MTTPVRNVRRKRQVRTPAIAQASLHTRILSDIKQRIVSGRWPPGHRIPFENDLAADYDCSRMTVNKAVSELARAGLIERRRKAGSFVCSPRSQAAVLEIRDLKTEVEDLGRVYHYLRLGLRRRKATEVDCRRLRLSKTVPIMAITCLHLGSGTPYCYEDRVINLAAVPAAGGEAFQSIAPGPWLIAHVPWTEAEHRITAMTPDAVSAQHLDIARSMPCLIVERMTWRERQPVTHVRFTYPGNARQMIARFEPSGT